MIAAVAVGTVVESTAAATKPNILIFYVDDLGYADLGVTGGKAVPTPNIDSIATNGVRFTNSYVSGCVCSPSRAGLMTGRYQQRFGFDANAEGSSKKDGAPRALDIGQKIFPQRMKELGYATGIVGKWHLGASEGYLPTQRGFDEFYGILPSGIGAEKGAEGGVPVYRNLEQVAAPADHTTAFGNEGESFIERHKEHPWFLYVPFTAVHAPHVAPQEYVDRYANAADKAERQYHAMIACLDDVIGRVLAKLRNLGLEENTLIFFASDNGGPDGKAVDNGDFQGGKWSVWEGGIRSPILMQWKSRISGGLQIPHPINQLDWLPTAVAAAGGEVSSEWQLDGVNLLPLLEGKTDAAPHEALFWRFGVQYAVRKGDWKLSKPSVNATPMLFNLTSDPGEENNLADQNHDKAKELQLAWDAWNSKNEPPRWIDERWNGLEERKRDQKARKKKDR